ncbi:U-box domain-containing protein 12 [Ananas comosus]|uniref:RING-type E3 ubiquitin transferase n=1 Tax=Ananas comosus TaxID=4615 RepID=A0A199VFB4_ANACO|nr:U-box domain-containing protein 12 [Ananas comosus]
MDPTTDDEEAGISGVGGGGGVRGESSAAEAAVEAAARVVGELSGLPESRGPLRRLCGDLARRVKLLAPLLDELRDCAAAAAAGSLGEREVRSLAALRGALVSAKDLLRSVYDGSKIYQALQRENFASKFLEVNEKIEKALDDLSYGNLHISEEVLEQVELVHAQFRRAKVTMDSPDPQLVGDLFCAKVEKPCDNLILKRISENLQLRTMNDMKKESVALHEMVISSDGVPDECLEEMSSLLKNLTDCVLDENPTSDTVQSKTSPIKNTSPVIPDEFRCPISLELMRDPVIVSTGQTYERSCIQKWLDSGHKTCPKTQQHLSHTVLTPNFVLKSLIAQWCEVNGVELPKNNKSGHRDKKQGKAPDCDRAAIRLLMQKIANGNSDEQRAAAGELRLLAKRNANNRVCIAEAGAIPLLVELLSSPDPRTQEHAVTALLNLSINEDNKGSIVNNEAIPKIVEVLKNGSMEARENAAATLFSLSVVDENKVTIGAKGAIPPLIDLLCEGTPRGKKDAATAIFNLCIYQGNKVRAVKAGIVDHLMRFLADSSGGMIDEALAILAILANNPEGRAAIVQLRPVGSLVEVIRTGSPRNKENAAAVLWSLCTADAAQLAAAREVGAEEALKELAEMGTERAKRKAGNLLELMRQAAEA